MTRIMGDATHANVPQLAAIRGQLQVVAGYDSGTPDIDWTPQDWAQFPGLPQVHIDQAFNSTVNTQAHVVVFDVEPGAYQPSQAGGLIAQNVTARPTIYVNQANIVATVQSALTAANWLGDTWAAIPGWEPGQPWPAPVQQAISLGARVVAVQNDYSNPAFDLSAVLDPAWPAKGNPMPAFMVQNPADGAIYLVDGGKTHHVTSPAAVAAYQSIGIQLVVQDATESAALLADFPPGQPAVSLVFPKQTLTGTISPE